MLEWMLLKRTSHPPNPVRLLQVHVYLEQTIAPGERGVPDWEHVFLYWEQIIEARSFGDRY